MSTGGTTGTAGASGSGAGGRGGTTPPGGSTGTAGVSGSGGSNTTGPRHDRRFRSGGSNTTGSAGTTGVSGSGGSNTTGSAGTTGTGGISTGGRGGGGTGGAGGTTPTGGTAGTANPGGSGGAGGGMGGVGASAGRGGSAGSTAGAGGGGGTTSVDCSSASAIASYPGLPGAVKSPLYTVTANGTSQFVEKLTKFAQEMQVHYAYFGVAKGCTATIAVTASGSFSSYKLSPKSRNITATKNGNTLTFSSGPNYLILQDAGSELLFILIDEIEASPPRLGDVNVKNLADYNVNNTGASLVTSAIQSAINAASGAAQNILYVPPGRYKVGELSLKSNMTLYLAAGAILDGSTSTGDYAVTGGPAVENTSHAVLHMIDVTNTNVLGRGVIDNNGSVIRGTNNDTPSFKIDTVRVDRSSKVVIDGILARDPVFWNTLVYDSDMVTIRNYKVINRRPTTTTYNQTDGVDFDASTNCSLYNAFLYTGDDPMSVKTEEEGTLDTKNIVYEKVVAYTNSAACKIGTKTYGMTMDGITFKDIDVVKAGRAMAIDANDTAVIRNTRFENFRVEAADTNLIDIECDRAPDWRPAPNTATVRDVYFTNVSSDVRQVINIHGLSSTVNVSGVHFRNFTVQSRAVTSQTDSDASWNINQYVSNITFQ